MALPDRLPDSTLAGLVEDAPSCDFIQRPQAAAAQAVALVDAAYADAGRRNRLGIEIGAHQQFIQRLTINRFSTHGTAGK